MELQALRRLGTALLARALATTGLVVAAAPAHAAITHNYAYALTESATANHRVTSHRSNPGGGAIEVVRSSTGSYRVRFSGLGTWLTSLDAGGISHVQPYGASTHMCSVGGWFVIGSDLDINVFCHNSSGARQDTRFLVNFFVATGTGPGEYSYAWADHPTTASYAPHPHWRWDADGGTASVSRSGRGSYRVFLPASADRLAVQSFFQVTAYGSGAVHCKPNAILNGNGWIGVRCRNHAGNLVDSRFTISYAIDPLMAGSLGVPYWSSAYVTVNSSGVATVAWSTDYRGDDGASVSRLSAGRYYVILENSVAEGHAMVTAAQLNNVRCVVTAFSRWTWTLTYVEVRCHDIGGTATDTGFHVAHTA